MHDHPWWFLTLVFWGGYVEKTMHGSVKMRAPTMGFRRAVHRHTVKVTRRGCWTVLLTGPETREWGFWVNDKFKKRNRYFYDHGHHQCES